MLADLYHPEIEFESGDTRHASGDLKGAVRVSLIPLEGSGLPRHDFIGVKFDRRFARHFKRVPFGGDRSAFFDEIERSLSEERKAARAARDAAGNAPKIAEKPPAPPAKRDECVQVVVCDTFRLYVKHSDGTVLVTPKDYELYL